MIYIWFPYNLSILHIKSFPLRISLWFLLPFSIDIAEKTYGHPVNPCKYYYYLSNKLFTTGTQFLEDLHQIILVLVGYQAWWMILWKLWTILSIFIKNQATFIRTLMLIWNKLKKKMDKPNLMPTKPLLPHWTTFYLAGMEYFLVFFHCYTA